MERARTQRGLIAAVAALLCALVLAFAPTAWADATTLTLGSSSTVAVSAGSYDDDGYLNTSTCTEVTFTTDAAGDYVLDITGDYATYLDFTVTSANGASYTWWETDDNAERLMVYDCTASTTYTVTLVSEYAFSASVTAQMLTNIKEATITLEQTSYTYTGSAFEPAVTVTLDGVTLTEGTDYEVSYWNNVGAGTAYVDIYGLGSYYDSTYTTFTIVLDASTIDEIVLNETKSMSSEVADGGCEYVKFVVSEDGWYTFTFSCDDDAAEFYYWVLSSDSSDYYGGWQGQWSGYASYLEAGTYYITLCHDYYGDESSLSYTVTVTASDPVTYITETDVAYTVPLNSTASDYLFYSFTADAGGTYTITLAGSGSDVWAELEICSATWNDDDVDSSSWIYIYNDSDDNSVTPATITLTLAAGETVNLVAWNYSSSDSTVTITVTGEGGLVGSTGSSSSTTTTSSSAASSTTTLAETGDTTASVVAGVCGMAAVALAAGVATTKRRQH